jgi:hypothetical protein
MIEPAITGNSFYWQPTSAINGAPILDIAILTYTGGR